MTDRTPTGEPSVPQAAPTSDELEAVAELREMGWSRKAEPPAPEEPLPPEDPEQYGPIDEAIMRLSRTLSNDAAHPGDYAKARSHLIAEIREWGRLKVASRVAARAVEQERKRIEEDSAAVWEIVQRHMIPGEDLPSLVERLRAENAALREAARPVINEIDAVGSASLGSFERLRALLDQQEGEKT